MADHDAHLNTLPLKPEEQLAHNSLDQALSTTPEAQLVRDSLDCSASQTNQVHE